MTVICLTGFSHSGKDTFGEILREKTRFPNYAFGDEIKKQVAGITPLKYSDLHTEKKDGLTKVNDLDLSVRKLMQDISTVFKNQYPDYYAQVVARKINSHKAAGAIITDLRFKVEENYIRNNFRDVCIIRVSRESVDPDYSAVSESEHLKIIPDYIVDNNGTIEDLADSVNTIYYEIFKGGNKNTIYEEQYG